MVWHIRGGWKKYQRLIVGGGVGWGGGGSWNSRGVGKKDFNGGGGVGF